MRLDLIEPPLALLSVLGLVAFGLSTILLTVLTLLWPIGISPQAHPLLWRTDLTAVLASLGVMLIPYLLARFLRAVMAESK